MFAAYYYLREAEEGDETILFIIKANIVLQVSINNNKRYEVISIGGDLRSIILI